MPLWRSSRSSGRCRRAAPGRVSRVDVQMADPAAGARPPRPPVVSPRALSEHERSMVLASLHEERFVDCAPAHVYATLLDEGTYLASERTMYRLLAAQGEVRERRDQLTHPPYARPELLASAAEPGLELGHHQAARPGDVDVLLPVRDPRHLQPLRRRLDRPAPGDRAARRAADRRDVARSRGSPASS